MAHGDRFDGKFLRNADPMHVIMPLIYPGRCDNEAYIFERIDLTAVNAFIDKKNAELAASGGEDADFKYTVFHVVVAALMKTITLRPKMNYFIAGGRMFERNYLSASFVIKKKFADNGEEGLAKVVVKPDDTIETIHEDIRKQVYDVRGAKGDNPAEAKGDATSDAMDAINKLPFFLVRFVVWLCRRLDVHGHVPRALIETDPYYNTVVFSNLGSIKMKAGYHHLTNWGTTSVFCILGERKVRPFYHDDGTFDMHDSIDLGITIDERIADGYYYSKTLRCLRALLQNPELLEEPMSKEIDY